MSMDQKVVAILEKKEEVKNHTALEVLEQAKREENWNMFKSLLRYGNKNVAISSFDILYQNKRFDNIKSAVNSRAKAITEYGRFRKEPELKAYARDSIAVVEY